jgi:hypothetical protein
LLNRVARAITNARRKRDHTYTQDWSFSIDAEAQHIAETVIAWCRDILANCRRPYGVDYFDLAVAVSDGSRTRDSLSLPKQKPLSLYETALHEALSHLFSPSQNGLAERRVSVALFSWGDATHAALPSR